MRKSAFVEDEYYHIYNRGVDKRTLFLKDADRVRFMALILLCQGANAFPQIGRLVPDVKHLMFDKEPNAGLKEKIIQDILDSRLVELVAFVLMQNHFHCILRELKEGGISKYMQRVGNAYAKYFNICYGRSGHLFENKFNSIHIDTNEYLNYLSAYIHLNIREVSRWSGREDQYPWSSFRDYTGQNRFRDLLKQDIILGQCNSKNEYKRFVTESAIKVADLDDVKHLMFDRKGV